MIDKDDSERSRAEIVDAVKNDKSDKIPLQLRQQNLQYLLASSRRTSARRDGHRSRRHHRRGRV